MNQMQLHDLSPKFRDHQGQLLWGHTLRGHAGAWSIYCEIGRARKDGDVLLELCDTSVSLLKFSTEALPILF